jgi:hypothetical protein
MKDFPRESLYHTRYKANHPTFDPESRWGGDIRAPTGDIELIPFSDSRESHGKSQGNKEVKSMTDGKQDHTNEALNVQEEQ